MEERELPDGVHYGLSFEEYVAIKGINWSVLKYGEVSAAHVKAAIDGKFGSDSRPKTFGRALHCRLLEPNEYALRFPITSGCQAILKSGKSKGMQCGNFSPYLVGDQWLCGVHKPRELFDEPERDVLSIDEARRVEAAALSAEGHQAFKLIAARGGFESTAIVTRNGIRCKIRMDKYIPRQKDSPPIIVDVKKVRSGEIHAEAVQRAIFNYQYDGQAAWYVDCLSELIGEIPVFVWIFVEDDFPHAVHARQASSDDILVGRIRYSVGWNHVLVGRATGEWPGVSGKLEMGGLPDWAITKYLSQR